ncbi:MAG: rubredoxin-like domain-containing protein [Desulforhopalus sp.]
MKAWECGVCNYLHKEDEPPEKCPVCEAPKKMFVEYGEKQPAPVQPEVKAESSPGEVKQWRCTVSGYVHTGTEPPEKCPICEATADQFEEVTEKEEAAEAEADVEKRWRCTVCGYIHSGAEPPEKCPVCDAPKNMFEEIDAEGNVITEAPGTKNADVVASSVEPGEKRKRPFFDRLCELVLRFHFHPISTHFPNGVLPAAVVFLALAVYFNVAMLETASYYNLIFVLVILPVVVLTGYIEWQKRYKGIKTAIFIIKIICALLVLASVNVLVFWRLLDPTVANAGSPYQMAYLGVAVVMIVATGIAGNLGGKLVFGRRG